MPKPTVDDPVREAARIARRMRRDGQSVLGIATELGVTQQTVKVWLKYRTPTIGPPKPRPKRELTVRHKKLAQELATGKPPTAAALAAGLPTNSAARTFVHRAKKNKDFVEYFNSLMDKAGLTEEAIAKGLAECAQATRVVGVAIDKNTGIISDHLEHPDYHVRHQTLRTALELRKRLNDHTDEKNPAAAPVHLHITFKQKQAYEKLVGGPLAFETIDILPEAEGEKDAAPEQPAV